MLYSYKSTFYQCFHQNVLLKVHKNKINFRSIIFPNNANWLVAKLLFFLVNLPTFFFFHCDTITDVPLSYFFNGWSCILLYQNTDCLKFPYQVFKNARFEGLNFVTNQLYNLEWATISHTSLSLLTSGWWTIWPMIWINKCHAITYR